MKTKSILSRKTILANNQFIFSKKAFFTTDKLLFTVFNIRSKKTLSSSNLRQYENKKIKNFNATMLI